MVEASIPPLEFWCKSGWTALCAKNSANGVFRFFFTKSTAREFRMSVM